MTHELGPASRALLEAARQGLAPDAAALQRVRDKVSVSVAAGTAAGALATKLGIVAILAAVATGAFVYTRDEGAAPSPRIEVPAQPRDVRAVPPPETAPAAIAPAHIEMPAHDAPRVRAARPHAAAPGVAIAPASPRVEISPATETAAASPRAASIEAPTAAAAAPRRSIAERTGEPPSAPRRAIDLAREVELVDQAMAALRRGDPRAALTAARTHARETAGAGQLAEDAAAIEIEALCRLHDPRVVAKLDAFDARWPRSAQRSRLSTSCP